MFLPFRLALFLTIFTAGFFLSGQTRAQMDAEVSTAEQVAMAFFKAADTNPDFEKWAKGSKEYKHTSASRAPDYLYREKQRLMKAWREYDPTRDLITIKGLVTVELKAIMDKDGNDSYWMYMTFQEGKATYFPFVYQEYKIAVIPQKIESLMMQEITREQYEMIKADFETSNGKQAALYVQLKPIKAYINQPYNIDDTDQWALISDIVSLTLRSYRTDSIFWNYGAKWYVSPVKKELNDLYKASPGSLAPAPRSFP